MLEGKADAYDDDGSLKDSYYIPNKGGSDRFSAAEENWADSEKKLKAAQLVINAGVASPEAIQNAKDEARWHQMRLDTRRDEAGNVKNPGVFITKYPNREERLKAVRDTEQKLEPLWQVLTNGSSEQKRTAMRQIRENDELFVVYNRQKAERGMRDFMRGKNAEQELGLVSMERTFSPATVIGKNATQLAQMMSGSQYDDRFKESIRRSFLVEKDISEIQGLVMSHENLTALGSWPSAAEIEEINVLRREKNGLPADQPSPFDLPVSPEDVKDLR